MLSRGGELFDVTEEPVKFEKVEDFYAVYGENRTYVRAEVRNKHIAEFDRNLWRPAGFRTDHRILEIGCGTGLFLAYLRAKGVIDFVGLDQDANITAYMPDAIAERVHVASLEDYLKDHDGRTFDRIVLLDVFEHFSLFEGVEVLRALTPLLSDTGRIVMRMPNCASPWGMQYQLGDLTHKAMYSPAGITHLATAAGLHCAATLPYTRGSRFRRLTTRAIEGLLNTTLTDPPAVWSANFVAVLCKNG